MNMRQRNREVLTDPFHLIRDLTLTGYNGGRQLNQYIKDSYLYKFLYCFQPISNYKFTSN